MGRRGNVSRRTVMTGAAALTAGAMLPVGVTGIAAENDDLQTLGRELAERLMRFRVVRAEEFKRLWDANALRGIHAYDMAARNRADGETGLMATTERIFTFAPGCSEDEVVLARATDAWVEYCMTIAVADQATMPRTTGSRR